MARWRVSMTFAAEVDAENRMEATAALKQTLGLAPQAMFAERYLIELITRRLDLVDPDQAGSPAVPVDSEHGINGVPQDHAPVTPIPTDADLAVIKDHAGGNVPGAAHT